MSVNTETAVIITKGEKAEFDLFLEKKTLPRCFDLTNFDEFKLCFPTMSGTPLEITHVVNVNGSSVDKVAPDLLGQIKVILGTVDTLKLKADFAQDIDLEWDNSITPNPKRKRLHKILNVDDFIC